MIDRTGSVNVRRTLRIGVSTAAAMAVLGVPAGFLWAATAPTVRYFVVRGAPVLADPEGQALIGIDGRFALITAIAGLLCGVGAYIAGGRDNDVPQMLALTAGGLIAALLAWRIGHQIGLGTFERTLRTAANGTVTDGAADLRARGVLLAWPLVAVATYGMLEVMVARLVPRDGGDDGSGEVDQVVGDELDLKAAPTARDVDGREAR